MRLDIGWFLYVRSRGNVLDIPVQEVRTAKTVNDVQVKKWVGVVSVKFKPGRRKVLKEAANDLSSVLDSLADFPDPAADVPIVKDEIIKEVEHYSLSDLMYKHDRRPCA